MDLKHLQVLFMQKLKEVMLVDFVEDYVAEFESQYDSIFGRYGFKEYDRTAPKYIKSDVVKYVRESLAKGVQELNPTGAFHLKAVSLDVFTYPDHKDTDSLKLFYFYLYGTPGEYVSISRAHFDKMFSKRKRSADLSLGRFGTMFMMTMDKYKALYAKSNGSTRGWPSPGSIRHPFSGAPPARIFEIVQANIEKGFDKYIKKAQNLVNKT